MLKVAAKLALVSFVCVFFFNGLRFYSFILHSDKANTLLHTNWLLSKLLLFTLECDTVVFPEQRNNVCLDVFVIVQVRSFWISTAQRSSPQPGRACGKMKSMNLFLWM